MALWDFLVFFFFFFLGGGFSGSGVYIKGGGRFGFRVEVLGCMV